MIRSVLHNGLLPHDSTSQGLEWDRHCPKAGFTTRRVPRESIHGFEMDRAPRAGDLVLARIESIGQHDGLQAPTGRRARIHVGDQVLVCYGNRYAVNQWEAVVPASLTACDLVATGGVAGKVRSRHESSRRPTGLMPLGLAVDDRKATINLRQHALQEIHELAEMDVPLIVVVGTSMDAGKTTSASALIRGLTLGGRRVAGIKLTGTGSSGDYFQMADAGASFVADFVDAGFVSTYLLSPEEVVLCFKTLVGHARESGAEAIVAEVADGLIQPETAALLTSEPFRRAVSSILLAAGDSFGAQSAARWLLDAGLPLRAISGIASSSALSAHETHALTGLPVLGLHDLERRECAAEWECPV